MRRYLSLLLLLIIFSPNVIFGKPNYYKGEWKNGRYHCKGVLIDASGNEYVGDFFRGRRHGYGIQKYYNGAIFEGEFLKGKRSNGTYYFSNGGKYIGRWKNGKKHGAGISINEYGTEEKQIWIEGNLFNEQQNGVAQNDQFPSKDKIYNKEDSLISKLDFPQNCQQIIQDFSNPKIDSKNVSPDKVYQLTVNDNGSVSLENLQTGINIVISPEVSDDCGSWGCSTPEKRAVFTDDGKHAITTSSFLGGPTIVWDVESWTDISEKVNYEYGGIGGGYFRLSPNGQYIAIMENHAKFGLSLAIIDLITYQTKMIAGSIYDKDIEILEGLPYKGGIYWLDEFMVKENYNFGFSNDSRTLIIKKNHKEYILYDIFNHSLSDCII